MNAIEKQFEKMGARVKIEYTNQQSINIRKDERGSFFQVNLADKSTRVQVLNSDAKDRHLLLLVGDQPTKDQRVSARTNKFLCGHDERDWFVATADNRAITVRDAKEKLKPAPVLAAQRGLRVKEKNKRHNAAYIRQGEWFFIPDNNVRVDAKLILRNEPLRQGSRKAHTCEELYRTGGVTVWVAPGYSNGLTKTAYEKYLRDNPHSKLVWRQMVRDAGVYVRGKVKHADHATINLNGWHRVQMNTEKSPSGMRMAFLD